MEAVAVEPAL